MHCSEVFQHTTFHDLAPHHQLRSNEQSVALLGWVRIGHTMVRVGLAMLQGARHEHIEALHGAAAGIGSLELKL